jgi:hypothetical protein
MANVQIIKFGVVYNEGARGNAGGAPKNDKVWLIARVDGKLVTANGSVLEQVGGKDGHTARRW